MNLTSFKDMVANAKATISDKEIFSSDAFKNVLSSTVSGLTRKHGLKLKLLWGNPQSYVAKTDNKTIDINCNNSMVQGLNRVHKFFIFVGLVCHECGHVLWTDGAWFLRTYESIMEDRIIKGAPRLTPWVFGASRAKVKKLLALYKKLENVIEDGYLELRLMSEYYGLRPFLSFLRNKQLSTSSSLEQMEEKQMRPESEAFNLLLMYAKYGVIRVENEEAMQDNLAYKVLMACKDTVDEARHEDDYKKRLELDAKILEEFFFAFGENAQDDSQNGQSGSDGDPQEGDSSDGNENASGSSQTSSSSDDSSSEDSSNSDPQNSDANNSEDESESNSSSGSNEESNDEDGEGSSSSTSDDNSEEGSEEEANGGSASNTDDESGDDSSNSSDGEDSADDNNSSTGGSNSSSDEDDESSNQNGSSGSRPDKNSDEQSQEGSGSNSGENSDEQNQEGTGSNAPSIEDIMDSLLGDDSELGDNLDSSISDSANEEVRDNSALDHSKPSHGNTEDTKGDESENESAMKSAEALMDKVAEGAAEEEVKKNLEQILTGEIDKELADMPLPEIHRGWRIDLERVNPVKPADYETFKKDVKTTLRRLIDEWEREIRDRQEGGWEFGHYTGTRVRNPHRIDLRRFGQKKLPEDIPDMAVAVYVDLSGSMSRDDPRRIKAARYASMLLYLFCQEMGIRCYIYGTHQTYGKSIKLYSFAEPDSIDGKDDIRVSTIGDRGDRCCRDGLALRAIKERLKSEKAKDKVLIAITDGLANSTNDYSYARGNGYANVKADIDDILASAKKEGVKVITAGISDCQEDIRKLYKDDLPSNVAARFVDVSDVVGLPKALVKIIKELIEQQ